MLHGQVGISSGLILASGDQVVASEHFVMEDLGVVFYYWKAGLEVVYEIHHWEAQEVVFELGVHQGVGHAYLVDLLGVPCEA